jgi:hypothetical protein
MPSDPAKNLAHVWEDDFLQCSERQGWDLSYISGRAYLPLAHQNASELLQQRSHPRAVLVQGEIRVVS